MAETLILDSEAVNALARPTERHALFERARAIITVAYERRAQVRVPAPVLAELYSGPRFDAAIDHLLKSRGLVVVELTQELARIAGGLLAKAKLPSSHAVDAFIVATAMSFDTAVIATADPDDIRRLAGRQRRITVLAL
jgi:predicted nucleic acid-binding protein